MTQAARDDFTDPPRFPVGTPEYAAYAAELRIELAKFAAGAPPYDRSDVPGCNACLHDWHHCMACGDAVSHDHIHGEE